MSKLERLGERMLARLVPKATAHAAVSWIELCYCKCGIDAPGDTPRCTRVNRICYSDSGCSNCYHTNQCCGC